VPFRSTFHRVFTLDSEIAGAVFFAVIALMVLAFWLGRKSRRTEPSHRHEWTLVEGGYTLAVLCMAVFLVWLSITNNTKESAFDRTRPQLVVRVVGFQWCWRFEYLRQDVTTTGTCQGGHDLPTLELPTHETIRLEVTSQDVVHEFWVPHMDNKVEAFPNHINGFDVTFDQAGTWPGHCAEFCGLYHSFMLFTLKVVGQATFHHWLAAHRGTVGTRAVPAT